MRGRPSFSRSQFEALKLAPLQPALCLPSWRGTTKSLEGISGRGTLALAAARPKRKWLISTLLGGMEEEIITTRIGLALAWRAAVPKLARTKETEENFIFVVQEMAVGA